MRKIVSDVFGAQLERFLLEHPDEAKAIMKAVNGDEDCIVVTDTGIVIRISLTQVSTYSRTAQGVKIISVGDTAKVSTVAIVSPDAESDGGAEVQAEAQADPDTAE